MGLLSCRRASIVELFLDDVVVAIQVELPELAVAAEGLFDLELVVVAPPGWGGREDGSPVHLNDLSDESFVMYDLPIGYGETVDNLFRQIARPPRVVPGEVPEMLPSTR